MGNVNINAFISQKWNLNINTTGVYVYQQDGLITLTDSTRMNQLMTSYNFSPTYSLGGQRFMNTIGGNFAYTNLNDRNAATKQYTNGSSFNTSINHNLLINKYAAGTIFSVNYSKYLQSNHSYQSIGINVGGNMVLLKSKSLSVSGTVGYYINQSTSYKTGNNTTFSLNGTYRLKKHSFNLFTNYIITPPVNLNPLDDIYKVPYAVNSRNFSGGINYSYSF